MIPLSAYGLITFAGSAMPQTTTGMTLPGDNQNTIRNKLSVGTLAIRNVSLSKMRRPKTWQKSVQTSLQGRLQIIESPRHATENQT